MRSHTKPTPESLTSSESTELKQVDVTSVGPNSDEIRSQSRDEDTQEMIESLTSTSSFKSAVFGFKKSDVIDQFSLAKDKMFEMSHLITSQASDIKRLKEINESNVQTVIDQSTILDDTSEIETLKGRLTELDFEKSALETENISLKGQIKDLEDSRIEGLSNDSTEKLEDLELKLSAAENAVQSAQSELDNAHANAERLEERLRTATTENDELHETIASLQRQLDEKTQAYESLNKTLDNNGEAYAHIGRVLADANRNADEIIAKANARAVTIRDEAEEDRQNKVAATNMEVVSILDNASDTIETMFAEAAKAREQLVISHNTLMGSARENQKELINLMVQQKELFKQQVDIATQTKLDDLLTKSSARLESGKYLLDNRQNEFTSQLEKIKNGATH